jgi:hypothetical protein
MKFISDTLPPNLYLAVTTRVQNKYYRFHSPTAEANPYTNLPHHARPNKYKLIQDNFFADAFVFAFTGKK